MTELEKLNAGLEYDFWDEEVNGKKLHAIEGCGKLNAIPVTDDAAREAAVRELFGSAGRNPTVLPVFNCDNGRNIHVGENFLANYNVTILDIAPVKIGDYVMIGPNTLITTVNHPLSPQKRRQHIGQAKPVTIGRDVWIGGNCTILPGVTIGNNVVIAAGAVVTKDVPSNCVVGGVPARVIREITDDTEKYHEEEKHMKSLNDTFKLNNGYEIPCVGFGTWQTPDGETAVMAVSEAIKAGYRHIDTAACYKNEVGVGRGIKVSEIERKKLFVTSKVWNTERGYEKTMVAFEKTLSDLGLGYLDLYLIHWPASASQFENWEEINLDTWRAMTELYQAGRIKAIGVSNFMPHHLEALMKTEVPPMVNQIEYHPGLMQTETVKYCKEHNILVEAWSPLGTGRMLNNETLKSIARKYGKSVAQLCIRWCLQNDILPLPKSVTPSRIVENTDVFDFEITEEDMAAINGMEYCGGSGLHPDTIDF